VRFDPVRRRLDAASCAAIDPVRRMVVLGLASTLPAALGGCGVKPADILRFGLRVDVQTPQGGRSGYGVVEAARSSGIVFTGGGGVEDRLAGEAIAVDLPGNAVLFALLRGRRGTDGSTFFAKLVDRATAAGATLVPPLPRDFAPEEWQEERKALRASRPAIVLPAPEYPLLGRLRDISDPASFEVVDPADLAASFGPGFALGQIVLGVVDQPPTSGIETRLRWLPDVYQRVNQSTFRPNAIPGGDFRGLFTTRYA
jgi:hypothetical protein